jgi:hypothetical protein
MFVSCPPTPPPPPKKSRKCCNAHALWRSIFEIHVTIKWGKTPQQCLVYSRNTVHSRSQLWTNDHEPHTRQILQHAFPSVLEIVQLVPTHGDSRNISLGNVIHTVMHFGDRSSVSVRPELRHFRVEVAHCTNTSHWRCHNCSCGTRAWSSRDMAQEFGLPNWRPSRYFSTISWIHTTARALVSWVVLNTYRTCNYEAPIFWLWQSHFASFDGDVYLEK